MQTETEKKKSKSKSNRSKTNECNAIKVKKKSFLPISAKNESVTEHLKHHQQLLKAGKL